MPNEIWVKGILCLLALPVVLWGDRGERRFSPRRASGLLLFAAVVAGAAYYNFGGFHGRGYVHHWEQFHYFLGSKYFPELDHDGLYAASLLAQRESRPRMELHPWTRDLASNEVVSSHLVLAQAHSVKARFTPERWRRFTADNDYFLDNLAWDYLGNIRRDHGYNPTPTWTFVARTFAAWMPARRDTLGLLGALDPLLLGVLFWFLFATYGSRVGALCLIVFGLGYPWRFDWVGGAFLRVDWLVAVGVAVCLMRRERYRWAGALLAYAGMVRIFPFALLLGPGVLAVRALVRKEDFAWAWRFAQGVALGVVLCAAAGSLAGRGVGAWGELAANLDKHSATWLTNNVGLENLVLYDTDTVMRRSVVWSLPEPWLVWQGKMNRLEDERQGWIWGLAALYLGLIAAASWRARRDEVLVLGIGAIFALSLLTCYYWAMLLLVPLRGDRWAAAVLLLLSAGLYGLHLATPPSFEMIYGAMSWALALLFLAWVGPAAWATVRDAWRRLRGALPAPAKPAG